MFPKQEMTLTQHHTSNPAQHEHAQQDLAKQDLAQQFASDN